MKKSMIALLTAFTAVSAFCGDSAFDRELSLWKKSSAKQVLTDTDCKIRGKSSIRIENEGTFSRIFELEPETDYELSFYVKGKDIPSFMYQNGKKVTNCGGRIMLHDGKKWGRITSDTQRNMPETGTFDWRLGKGLIKSSEWGKKLNVMLSLRGKGTIWYDEVQLKKTGKTGKEKFFRTGYDHAIQSVAIVPQGCFGFFEPGEKAEFVIYCKSNAKKLEYAYTVKDENGKQILSVPRRPLEKKFTIPGQACGYYVVEADFFANGKKSSSLQSAFVVSRKIGKRDPFFQMGHGVNGAMYDGFKRIGVGTISLKLSWLNPKSSPERMWNYHYNTSVKRYLTGNDFELIANPSIGLNRTGCYRTPQQLTEGMPLLSDRVLNEYMRFIDLILAHTKGKIKMWQWQLELPSSASPSLNYERSWSEAMSDFLILTRIGARKVRKADPSVKILAGGNNVQAHIKDIEPVAMGDLVHDFDQYIIDGYTGNWDLSHGKAELPEIALMSFYQDASRLSESLGKGKRIHNAESGYAIFYGSPLDRGLAVTQAELTARYMIISKAGPVDGFELHMPCLNFGHCELKNTDRCMTTVWKPVWFNKQLYQIPMPGGAMYAAAAAQLAFVKDPIYFHEGNNYGAVFNRPDGNTLLVLWNIEREVPFTFTFPAAAQMVSMYGRESMLSTGKQTLKLNEAPVYLTLKTPAKEIAKQVRDALRKQSPQIRCAGYELDSRTARIFIRNISQDTQTGTLQGKKITVLPQQTLAMTVKKTAATLFFQTDDGRKYEIPLKKNQTVRAQYLRNKPVFDGSGKWLAGLQQGTLIYPDNIFPITALQQELGYFKSRWNANGHNVSADYWIAYDKENFYLAVDVDDPIHLQRQTGADIWMDDCLQFVFANGEPDPRGLANPTEKIIRPSYNFAAALTKRGTEFTNYSEKKTDIQGCKAHVIRKGNRTFYELCIPFKTLGKRPDLFSFVVFDNNYTTKRTAPYHLALSGGVTSDADVSELKKVIYEPPK